MGYLIADDVRVVDEQMHDVPADGQTLGEVIMRGNNTMKGYYRDPEATERAFAGGWFHSGDLAVMHPDGYIELRDRKKDIIISGGENISTIEVEQAISAHPAVLEAAVVAVPDDYWGEVPKAFVTLKPGAAPDRGRAARLLPHPTRRLQGPQGDRVRRPAEDLDRQGAEVRAAREGMGRPGGANQLKGNLSMAHPLVDQLRFARSEFRRGLAGITDKEARRRFLPMNCISWNIGHLAWQEQRYWLLSPQGILLLPEIDKAFRYGAPASTPPLSEVWTAWEAITAAADPWLDAATTESLLTEATRDGQPTGFTIGSRLLRTIYHYWFHTGENAAIRQNLGHVNLPDFVGNIEDEAPYRPA